MGYSQPVFPDADPEKLLRSPLRDRLKYYQEFWAEWGFGSPRKFHMIYFVKILGFYLLGGSILITLTSGMGPFWEVGNYWNNPLFYQKFVIWTMTLEIIGLAGSWGPLTGKFKPMTGGILFWGRLGTIRQSPFKWIPGTAGNNRTLWDLFVYYGFIVSMGVAFFMPGQQTPELSAFNDGSLVNVINNAPFDQGLVQTTPLYFAMIFLILIGIRDKVVFMAARSEQYIPALIIFMAFSFVDMIIALKMLLVICWFWAAFSKLNKHFTFVIPPMVSNTPFWPPRWLKKAHYRDFPKDMRPSKLATFMAHVLGTLVEGIVPLVLLFSTNQVVTVLGCLLMVGFCIFIISTFPVAVPLEWNMLFAMAAVILFLGFPNQNGFSVFDLSSWWVAAIVIVGLSFFPIYGSIRPDKISFLASYRQYGGNWATVLWAFHPEAEHKMRRFSNRPCMDQIDQLQQLGNPYFASEITLELALGWRSLHTQAKGLFSVLMASVPDHDHRRIREGEFAVNAVLGFNFGDGHFMNEELFAELGRRCDLEPGDLVVAWVESEALWSGVQHYKLIDASLGVIERGTWKVSDCVDELPHLPNGPIDRNITWRADVQPPFTATDIFGPDPTPSGVVRDKSTTVDEIKVLDSQTEETAR